MSQTKAELVKASLMDWAPVIAGAVVLIGLTVALSQADSAEARWEAMGFAAAALGLAAAAAFVVGAAMRRRSAATSPLPTDDAPMRAWIAPVIIGVGTVGIASLAIAVMFFLFAAGWNADNTLTPIGEKLDAILLGVFSSVLSVFATWVGTVLAFYFTNESFRAASESARKLVGEKVAEDGLVADATRMIPLDKITRIDLKPGEKVEAVEFARMIEKFGTGNTITRLPIFDSDRRAMLILRKAPLEAALKEFTKADKDGVAKPAAAFTAGDYLSLAPNQGDARNFQFIPLKATLASARIVLETYGTLDLFVTDHGKPEEPVKGWITDDRLR